VRAKNISHPFLNENIFLISNKTKNKAMKKTNKKHLPKISSKKKSTAPSAKKSVIKKTKMVKSKTKQKKPVIAALKKTKKIAKPLIKKSLAKKVANSSKLKIKPKNKVKEKPKTELKVKSNTKAASKTSQKIIAKAKITKAAANEKKSEKIEPQKQAEKKHEINKIILVRRTDGKKSTFKVGDYAVYPSHGVGKIIDIEKTFVLGQTFSCYLMFFEKEKLTIKIPTHSVDKIGLRHLVSKSQMDEVFTILRSGIKKLKGMWSRRAQEYETKINSGDIVLLAEVLRDLTRDIEDGDRSYSERIIYETAVHRLASEHSIVYSVEFEDSKNKVISTAKDKLNSEGKVTQKDGFDDDFDLVLKKSDLDEDEEIEEEEEEDEDEEDDYDDEDDDEKPRKKRK